jgi:uncharacterized membrane protein YdjX (TVP38/TMEM64 family)
MVNLKRNIIKNTVKVLLTGILILMLFFIVKELIVDADHITSLSKSMGIFGPILLILLMSLGILLTPIPSAVLIVAAGYLYGTWMGALYSYIGHLLAAIITFAICQTLKMNGESRRYESYKKLVHKNKKILYFLYMLPIIPISVITIITSTSKIKWKEFLKIISISFVPNILIFSFFGERISNRNPLEIGLFLLAILVVILIVLKVWSKKDLGKKNKKIKK